MSSKLINLFFYRGLVFLIIGFLFVSTHVLAFNGPHVISTNECDVCHIPHHAADEMLWARATAGPFGGVKRLCATCHGTGLYGARDRFGIFESGGDMTYDHVMGLDASINGPSIKRKDWAPFPLKEKEGGDGFYCGSCHDPHLDPYEPIDDRGGGDYLRQEASELIKDAKDKKISFCAQCHEDIIYGDAFGHGNKEGCFDCHHPHASRNPSPKILISPLIPFQAIPNCPGFSDSTETVAACYGCHREGSGFDGSFGAPLAGDGMSDPREHHPMGEGADASTSGHQPTQAGPLSPSGELYCGSCHTVHNGTNDNYLNPQIVLKHDPANSAVFCITCHSDKTIEDLGPHGEGHHQISPNNQCLFCHSIHNAPNDPDALFQTDEDEADQFNSSVSVDVIMRIPPENLAWADKRLDTDTKDYEDACYGCHFRPDIVGREFSLNEENSLLMDNVKDMFFSHRFNAIPSPAIRLINTFDDRLPIVSDGQETETKNDYGVEEGRIWCGSCHNVHRQNRFSTEFHEDYKERRSAYLRAENYGSSLCYRCHTSYHEDLRVRNHSQDKAPNPPKTSSSWKPIYYEGYSGGIGGLTNGETRFDTAQGEVVCQTCHSVHTAMTDWDGGSNEDDLLEHGRLLVKALDEGFCQDCHPEIHGGAGGNCVTCHSPHNGINLFTDQRTSFKALPNVPGINDSEDPNFNSSSFCYGCHQPHHLHEDDFLITFGAAPIYGDFVRGEENTKENMRDHHPMGTEASLDDSNKVRGGRFVRAPGTPVKFLYQEKEITCTTCHNGLHGGSKANNFLRWNFMNDNAEFCIQCHNDKDKLKGEHFRNFDSSITRDVFYPNAPENDYKKTVSCKQCMFCHFIHDGKERESNLNLMPNKGIRADVDALMRQPSIPLIWKVRGVCADDTCINIIDDDPYDYEDMCYGCHGDPDIVKGTGHAGALLQPDAYFTHRYTCAPDPNSPTKTKIEPGGVYPLSDGPDLKTKNDYGTKTGHIFCGTCHNVHDGSITPYLNHAEGDLNLSPYEPYSFCEECHDAETNKFRFVHNSHPINRGPNYPVTVNSWPGLYSSGKSGSQGGITSNSEKIICLTCHNVHAAATNWKGLVSTDPNNSGHGKLLVKDNLSSKEGSDMCQDCHKFNNKN